MKRFKIVVSTMVLGFALVGSTVYVSAKTENGLNAGVSSFLSNCLSEKQADKSEEEKISTRQSATSEENEEAQKTEETICGYTNLGIANVENNLNVRKNADEDSKVVGKMPKNAGCEILDYKDGWYKIKSGKVTGWVSEEYLLTGEAAKDRAKEVATEMAIVQTQTLFVREEPTTESAVLTMVAEGTELEVLKTSENGWVKIDIDNEKGWICGDYVTISYELPKAATIVELQFGEGATSGGAAVAAYALQFVGNPYVWGGTSLTNGADCSGFTMSVYAHFGIGLPHYSAAQSNYGTRVSASQAQPGDLFFYGNGSRINHVAIYIGGGQIVHASSARTGIKISNAYYRTPICVVRLIR